MSVPRDAYQSLIAVDVGNSRLKWGQFVFGRLAAVASLPLREPASYERQSASWALRVEGTLWVVSSVNPDASGLFLDWLKDRGFHSVLVLDDPSLLPLRVDVEKPTAVGIDRLLNAVAVNARRAQDRPAVIADCGSAITVDGVAADGAFGGGTIAPGLSLAARGLHEFTYWLPLVRVTEPPPAIGKSTPAAMQGGIFWGTVGAVKELVRRVAAELGGTPLVFVTGGDGELIAPHLDTHVELVSDLTLHGIYLSTEHAISKR